MDNQDVMDISVVFWNNDSATKTGGIQTSALLVSGHSYCDIGVTMKVSNRPIADVQGRQVQLLLFFGDMTIFNQSLDYRFRSSLSIALCTDYKGATCLNINVGSPSNATLIKIEHNSTK